MQGFEVFERSLVAVRKRYGIVYTPMPIAMHLVRRLEPKPDERISDISCGCGVLLIAVAEWLHEKHGKKLSDILHDNLFGVDIVPINIEHAKTLFRKLGDEWGEEVDEPLLDKALVVGDAFDVCSGMEGTLDVVIGNPPYVAYKDLDEAQRRTYFRFVSGNCGTFNLFHVFMEFGYNLLKPDAVGRMGYVVPRTWMVNHGAKNIRKALCGKVTMVEDFGSRKMFGVDTYTCLTYCDTGKHGDDILYRRLPVEVDADGWLNEENPEWSKMRLSEKGVSHLSSSNRLVMAANSGVCRTLGELYKVSVGIATLADDVYMIPADADIEPEVTRKFVKISEIKAQENLPNVMKRIIFPYRKGIGGKWEAISEDEMVVKYPKCHAHLLANREKLDGREKGKIDVTPWYAYGRTQMMDGLSGPALLFPVYMKRTKFYYVNEPDLLFSQGYCIRMTEESPMGLEELSRCLRSAEVEEFMRETSTCIGGDFALWQKMAISRIPLILFETICTRNTPMDLVEQIEREIKLCQNIVVQ